MYIFRAHVYIKEKLIFPDLPVITVHLRTEHDMLIFLSATRRAFLQKISLSPSSGLELMARPLFLLLGRQQFESASAAAFLSKRDARRSVSRLA